MKILHLSDLHFGYDQDDTAKTQRKLLLDSLLLRSELSEIEVVLITGDVAWQCRQDGYATAGVWIEALRSKVKKGAEFISCCGNHDVDHAECMELQYISDAQRVGETLRFESLGKLQRRFQQYINFCEEHKFKKLSLGGEENYLIGHADLGSLRFWVFNSAWYALHGGERDQSHLWLGRSLFDLMDAECRETECNYVITLMHHPKEWLNENETQSADQNKSLFELIAGISDLCFTGHTHGNIQEPTTYHSHMKTYSAGATYVSTDYHHNFSIYSLEHETDKITRYPFESINKREWRPCDEQKSNIRATNQLAEVGIMGKDTQSKAPNVAVKSKSQLLCEMLGSIKASLIRLSESDLAVNRTIIWPVVPRKMLTTIHLAQLELMNCLCQDLGWSIKAIISNCGANPQSPDQVKEFEEKVKRYCRRGGVDKLECTLLGDYFQQQNPLASKVMESFIRSSSATKMPDLANIKNKNYPKEKIDEISRQPVLDYILPLLQMTVVEVVARQVENDSGQKPVVLAGVDEKQQWRHTISVIGGDDIGAILIPELSTEDKNTINQDSSDGQLKKIIHCVSKEDIEESISMGNVARWLYKMFVVVPNYSSLDKIKELAIFREIPTDPIDFWPLNITIPECIDKGKLIDCIWKKLEFGNIFIK